GRHHLPGPGTGRTLGQSRGPGREGPCPGIRTFSQGHRKTPQLMAAPKKFYVVWKGKRPGIYESWADCKAQIEGFKGAQYKSFPSFAAAKTAYSSNYLEYKGTSKGRAKKALGPAELLKIGQPDMNSIAVDAASSGHPGRMEYRGVDTKTKRLLFSQ